MTFLKCIEIQFGWLRERKPCRFPSDWGQARIGRLVVLWRYSKAKEEPRRHLDAESELIALRAREVAEGIDREARRHLSEEV